MRDEVSLAVLLIQNEVVFVSYEGAMRDVGRQLQLEFFNVKQVVVLMVVGDIHRYFIHPHVPEEDRERVSIV